jgi:hypothetical protein
MEMEMQTHSATRSLHGKGSRAVDEAGQWAISKRDGEGKMKI